MKTKSYTLAAVILLMTTLVSAQTARQRGATGPANPNQAGAVQPAASSTPVSGSGTPGRVVKWLGSSPASFVIGDSSITEDKFGKVGIGTPTPTSPLTVQGMIETTLGGYKFPDGTIQTTAGLGSVFTNSTLVGNGTSASPLGVAVPLTLAGASQAAEGLLNLKSTAGGAGLLVEAHTGIQINATAFGLRSHTVNGVAIDAISQTGNVIQASTSSGVGFVVSSQSGRAISGFSSDNVGLHIGSNTGNGIFAYSNNALAAKFDGSVEIIANAPGTGNLSVAGTLSKGGGSFKIDHPLDPENKYLYHSFVESPDMMNIYNGNVMTNADGEAIVTLPDYFDALNKDFRYQLTVIGTFAQAIVAEKVKDNRFTIKTSVPGVEVSWQVTGIRQDPWANKNRIPVVEEKEERDRGHYLHPAAYDKPEEKGVEWARDPAQMKQIKEEREKNSARPQRDNR